jgi:trans-aconitate methyltransferase
MSGLRFSGESRIYFARGRLDFLHRWWVRHRSRTPRVVLDYGCGLGETTGLLASEFSNATVVGMDSSKAMIEAATRQCTNPRVSFSAIGETAGEINLDDIDITYVNGVVHHMEPRDRTPLFEMLRSKTAADGLVAVFENNPLNPGTRFVMSRIPFDWDAQPLTHWKMREHFREARFKVIHEGFLFYFPKMLALLRPLERSLEALPLGAQYGVFGEPC